MPSLKNLIESLSGIWNEATPAARIGLGALTVLCIGLIGFVGYWSSQPSFVTLISDGDTGKINRVIDELDKKGIKYELGGAGGILRVDQRSLARARIAASKLGVSSDGSGADTGMGGSMWMDPTERKNKEVHQRESGLEATIRNYAAVDKADVHLNVPINGPFERRISKPTASVLLTLVPGQRLTEENVLAIASTVSYAIENLKPESVRITDRDGNVYDVSDEMNGHVSNQIDFTSQLERKLAHKAESLLTKTYGYGNANVQVSLEMEYTQKTVDTKKYDSEGKVVQHEDLLTDTTTQLDRVSGGVAGVSANLDSPNSSNGNGKVKGKKETIKSDFLVPETLQREINNTPIRKFMTVSVLVNEKSPGVLQDGGTRDPAVQNRVEQLVKMAVGFKEDTDQIYVDFAAFVELTESEPVAAPFDWVWLNEILKNVSLAVAAVVALVIGFLTLRHFKQSSGPTNQVTNSSQGNSINQLNELARSNPEVFTKILKSWAGDKRDAGPTESSRQNAA